MRKRCRRLDNCLVVLALALITSSCATGDNQGPLFQDDFDNQRNGWGTDQRGEFERGYEEGSYFVELYEPDWFAYACPGMQFDDVGVEVEAYLASGSQDGH